MIRSFNEKSLIHAAIMYEELLQQEKSAAPP